MRRWLLGLLFVIAMLAIPSVAQARHGWHGPWRPGHWHGGWGHNYYRSGWSRWGGWYGGGINLTVGWPAYGYAYYPAYGYGYPAYGYSGYLDCYGYPGVIAAYPAYGVRYSPGLNQVDYFIDSSYEPAELAYGPLAVKQFLGLDRNFALGNLRAPVPPLATAPLADETIRLKVRTSNAESRRRAERYIAQGDELFQKHNWHSALQKYKLAGQLAPDVAECFWRQGHALVAVNQFGQAAMAFRRALLLDDDIARDGFHLNDLYTDGEAAKRSHLEALAGEALAASTDADIYFLIGVTLHYDGQTERAQPFFDRASALSSDAGRLVKAFTAPKVVPAVPTPAIPVKTDEMEI